MPTFSSVLSLGAVPGAVLPLPPLPAVLARYAWCLLALEFIPSAAGAGGGTTVAGAATVVSSVILVLSCLIWALISLLEILEQPAGGLTAG